MSSGLLVIPGVSTLPCVTLMLSLKTIILKYLLVCVFLVSPCCVHLWHNYAQIHWKWCVKIDMDSIKIQPKNNQMLKLIHFATVSKYNQESS